jgi:hypothetical protein
MRKTGVLILLLLVLGFTANCAREDEGPAEATQEVVASSSDAAAVQQNTEGAEESQAGSAESGKPRIAFDEKDFDFGKVETGEQIEHVYKFRNTGDGTLVVHKVRSG